MEAMAVAFSREGCAAAVALARVRCGISVAVWGEFTVAAGVDDFVQVGSVSLANLNQSSLTPLI
jgi:hypothetical protein